MRCGLEEELLDPVVKSQDFGGRLGGLWGMKRVVALESVSHVITALSCSHGAGPLPFN